MNTLKNLAILRPGKVKMEVETQEKVSVDLGITYFQSGYGDSKNANGSSHIFKTCLDNLYQNFKEKCRMDDAGQNRLNRPYIDEKEKQTTELKKTGNPSTDKRR